MSETTEATDVIITDLILYQERPERVSPGLKSFIYYLVILYL